MGYFKDIAIDVMNMYEFEKMSPEQIAKNLDINLDSVISIIVSMEQNNCSSEG